MALGGGTFLVQNKVLPGAYINFISVAQASATLSDRGIVTIPLAMNWGPEGKIFTVEQADFIKNCQKIFGYAYTADELKPMREIFLHAKTVHFFRLGSSGVKASNTYATAKYPGTRGNDLRVVITANENSTEQKPLFDVETFLGTVQVDLQEGVAAITDLKANSHSNDHRLERCHLCRNSGPAGPKCGAFGLPHYMDHPSDYRRDCGYLCGLCGGCKVHRYCQ